MINEIEGLAYVATGWVGHVALMSEKDLQTLFVKMRDIANNQPDAIDRMAMHKFADIAYAYWKDSGEN